MGLGSTQNLKRFYWGEKALDHEADVQRTLSGNAVLPGLYLITLAQNPSEQLDILPSYNLLQPTVRRRLPHVVGAAMGREEAFALVEEMARDIFRSTGHVDFRHYFCTAGVGTI